MPISVLIILQLHQVLISVRVAVSVCVLYSPDLLIMQRYWRNRCPEKECGLWQ